MQISKPYIKLAYMFLGVLVINLDAKISFAEMPCFEIAMNDKDDSKTKIICCKGKIPGFTDRKNTIKSFVSLKDKRKEAVVNKKTKKAQTLKAILKTAKPLCVNSSNPGNEPTPVPTATPSPEATSTPQAGPLNFDSQGNVTSEGKECFEIPSELSANVFSGGQEINIRCVTCHGHNLLDVPNAVLFDRPFTFIRNRTKSSPMNFDEQSLPDSALANIAAYVNRFREHGCD